MAKVLMALAITIFLSCEAFGQKSAPSARSCESLSQIELKEAKVLTAGTVAAGALTPPSGPAWLVGDPLFYKSLRAFCRVIVEAKPNADSSIRIEVWMPADNSEGGGWNGKLQGHGNGGFGGEIGYLGMAASVSGGYA